MLKKTKLSSLKDRIAAVEHTLATVEQVTAIKQDKLTDIVERLTDSEKALDDDFSVKRMTLQKEYAEYEISLEKEVSGTKAELNRLEIERQGYQEVDKVAEAESIKLRASIKQQQDYLDAIKVKSEHHTKLIEKSVEQEKQLKASITAKSVELEQVTDSVQKAHEAAWTTIETIKKETVIATDALIIPLENAKSELKKVKTEVNEQKRILMDAKDAFIARETDISQRENALIVKTRAFNKEFRDFEEQRHHFNATLQLNGYK